MTNKIVRFYNWQDWKENLEQGVIGQLGSNITNKSMLAMAAHEAEDPDNEVWLLTATKAKKWRVSAWLRLRPRQSSEPKSNAQYSTIVYYDLAESKVVGNTSTGELAEIPEIDEILQEYKNLGMQGNAGFEFQGNKGDQILNRMQKIPGTPVALYCKNSPSIDGRGSAIPNSFSGPHLVSPDTLSNGTILLVDEGNSLSSLQGSLTSLIDLVEQEYQNKPGEDVDAVVKRRIGQSEFRTLLEKIYGPSCHISGILRRSLLIASHIVPWSKSSADEKTDPENGLLLAVNWDAVFDKGFISFDDHGNAIFSDELDKETSDQLGIDRNVRLREDVLTPRRIGYLQRHREEIFERWKKTA